jgi:hypothetical protein
MPKAARAVGMSYDELIQACLRAAADRQRVPLPEVVPAAGALSTG